MAFQDLSEIREMFDQHSRAPDIEAHPFWAWLRDYKARWMRDRYLEQREPKTVAQRRVRRYATGGRPTARVTCSVPGCESKHHSRGLCQYHYQKARRACTSK